MTGCAELAHQKHIHWSTERGRDFISDGGSTARQRQNDDVIPARVFRQTRRQHTTCVTAIDKRLVLLQGAFFVPVSYTALTSGAPAAAPVPTPPPLRRDA